MSNSTQNGLVAPSTRVNLTRTGGVDEVRRMILERRERVGATVESSRLNGKNVQGLDTARLEELRQQLESYRNTLDFDLASPVPVLGRAIASFKRLVRRVFRAYIARQSAFNEYSLDLNAALTEEYRRRARELETQVKLLEFRLEVVERTLATFTESDWMSQTKARSR